MSGVTKLVPAKLRSSPRMRSSSSGWPIDSWICRIIWSGASSTSIAPLGQFGAASSSSASSAIRRPPPTKPKRASTSAAALLAKPAVTVERAVLRDAVRVGGDADAWQQEPVALDRRRRRCWSPGGGWPCARRRPLPSRRCAGRIRPAPIPRQAVRTTRGASGSDRRTTATRIHRAARGGAATSSRTAPASRCCAPTAPRAPALRAGRPRDVSPVAA